MYLVISLIFSALAYTFFRKDNMQGFYINIGISLIFISLLIKNIIQMKKNNHVK
ncbi:protein YpmT [Arcobacter sp. YIC-310]|uniref:protein YpmT n=1 Tax=Arcobacter sp. YIC-310 TaxID=3376632 RepID=UPI003C1B4F28